MAETISEMKEQAKSKMEEVKEQVLEPETEARIAEQVPEEVNRRIRRELEARVYYFAQHADEIDVRLDELDHEWDIERLLEANAGILALAGLTFGIARSRWYLVSALAAYFLVQHAIQGWSPPASLFRRLGIRTTREINHERYALKALRGDFGNVHAEGDAEERARQAIDAADANL